MELQLFTNSSQLSLVTAAQARELLAACNTETAAYGMVLSEAEIAAVVEARRDALVSAGRIDFSGEIPAKLARAFASSPYLDRASYAETLCALVELFYDTRNETDGRLSDDRLIAKMRELFDELAEGSLDRLTDLLWSLSQRLGGLDAAPDARAWAMDGRDVREMYTKDW